MHVYDTHNFAQVKEVIPLPGQAPYQQAFLRLESYETGIANAAPASIASCRVNKCLYILNTKRQNCSVLRMAKGNGQHFIVSPFLSDHIVHCMWQKTVTYC